MPDRGRPLDIKALLSVALDQRPKDDLQERVMDRIAAITTAIELARLVFIAPVDWLLHPNHADPRSGDDDAPPPH
ncbi:MAG: hypothetical protein IPK80_18890 [Nannocystis sp.]|nr:hypothetical protein [Nannocystis sp.]